MGVSEARANLTEVIAKVRLLKLQVVLTRREKPQAVLVSPEFYEQALEDRRRVAALDEGTVKQRAALLASMLKKLDEIN
ncbi:hypothetical protein BG418_18255 [Streptomyces sp. CBMA152]|nr:hypothetical protein [Streptomyces sp. CBMA152]